MCQIYRRSVRRLYIYDVPHVVSVDVQKGAHFDVSVAASSTPKEVTLGASVFAKVIFGDLGAGQTVSAKEEGCICPLPLVDENEHALHYNRRGCSSRRHPSLARCWQKQPQWLTHGYSDCTAVQRYNNELVGWLRSCIYLYKFKCLTEINPYGMPA